VLVVRAAAERDAIHIVHTRESKSIEMIELQVASRPAPAPALIFERAAPAIALVNLTLDRIRDVAG
jgi:hypothetical protein